MSSYRVSAWFAWAICGVCVVLTALGIGLEMINRTGPHPVSTIYPGALVIAVLFPFVGVLIASRRSENPIGWVLCGMGLSEAITAFSGPYSVYALLASPEGLPGGVLMSWITFWVWQPGFSLIAFLLLLFPTGRLPSPRWRIFAWFAALATAVGMLSEAIFSWPLRGRYLGRIDI